MAASTSNIIVCRDSGVEVVDNDARLHNGPLEPYDHIAAGGDVAHDSSVVDEHKIHTSKRTLSDANPGGSEPSWPVAKRRISKVNNISNEDTYDSNKYQRRVLCPLYVQDPNKHAQKASCHNKGFQEMSRLKQHLVKEHKISKGKLEFKTKSFQSLGGLEAKWRHVYRVLFPEELEEDIPSPCKEHRNDNIRVPTYICLDNNISRLQNPIVAPSISNTTATALLKTIMDCNSNNPGLAAAIRDMLDDFVVPTAFANAATYQNPGLFTPPSSVESSPALSSTDTFASSDSGLPPGTTATKEALSSSFDDLTLFPSPGADSPPQSKFADMHFPCDPTMLVSLAQSATTPAVKTVQSIRDWSSVFMWCTDCSSVNIRPTKGNGPSVHVCSDCWSTNVKYNYLSQPMSSSMDLGLVESAVPPLTVDTLPPLSSNEFDDPCRGVERVSSTDLSFPTMGENWDDWNNYGWKGLGNEAKEVCIDIDKFLEF